MKIQDIRDGKKMAVAVQGMQVSLINIEKCTKNLQLTQSSSSGSTKLELPPLPPLILGLDVPLKEVKEKLLEDDGVSLLVLTAPGGCGKTTLATMFCQDQQVKDKFKRRIYFITVSQKGKLDLIVQRLYEEQNSFGPPAQNDTDAVQRLQYLCNSDPEPQLVVLDDVWSGSEYVIESFQCCMSNYKILVTSRSEFSRFGTSYHLPLLEEGNAMKLFRHSASLGDMNSHVLDDLSRKIVKRCNGFPLAITVVGRSLCRQPIEIWKKRVTEWSKGSSVLDSETKLLLCLQSSLDALDKELKECFLDLASFPEDSEIPIAILRDMWAELYDLDEEALCFANVYELNNRSLANLVDERKVKMAGEGCYKDCFVKQHDLLRELAIYNAKLDLVEHRTRLFLDICGNQLPKWWREQKYEPIRARLLSISIDREFSTKWPNMQLPETVVLILNFQTKYLALPQFVEKMDKLKVLIVTKKGYRANLNNFEQLGFLSNLKTIRLESISIDSITRNHMQLKSVQKLSLCNCDFFWKFHSALYQESVKLYELFPNLEELEFSDSSCDEDFIREFCKFIHLKKLSISPFGRSYFVPTEIGKLVNLEVLRLNRFSGYPDSIRNLKKLKVLDLGNGHDIRWLPACFGELSSLKKLDMRKCFNIRELPSSVLDLHQLEEVICNEASKKLWEPFLPTLKNLQIVVV